MKRAHIDLTQVKTSGGLHGIKFGDTVSQMLSADPAEAISFAQRFVPARGVQRVAIVPVIVVEADRAHVPNFGEKKEFRR
jgi:hypothetical protein